jgi:hypothetical protein
VKNSIISLALVLTTVLYALQFLPQLPRALYAQSMPVNSNLGTLKLLTDRAIQGFQNNSTAYSISQLFRGYDVLLKLANSSEADKIPGGTNGALFLLGDTIKLLTLNSNSAVRNATVSYLNALEEQVTHLLALGNLHSKSDSTQSETLMRYINRPYGIRVDYPLNWIIRIDNNYSLPSVLTYLHPHVIASFYLPNATDGLPFFYIGVNSDLSKQFKQPHFTIEQYLIKSIESKRNSQSFPEFKLIQIKHPEQWNITLAGHPAYEIAWTYKHRQYGLREIMEFGTVVKGTQGYFLDYAASTSKFSKYLPLADVMKSSFAIVQGTLSLKGP